jgi:hypothetical protein
MILVVLLVLTRSGPLDGAVQNVFRNPGRDANLFFVGNGG